MERGGRGEALPPRGREKILCYITMQSPGKSVQPRRQEAAPDLSSFQSWGGA